jgi:hypothetical protein
MRKKSANEMHFRLLIGYFLSYLSFLPSIHYFRVKRRKYGSDAVSPEKRLWWLLFGMSRIQNCESNPD